MADFQYTDAPIADLGELAEVDGPFGPERSPITVLPPLFSKQDEPLDYSFKRQPPGGFCLGLVPCCWSKQDRCTVVIFDWPFDCWLCVSNLDLL